jgi:hypothetical protein
MTRPLDVHPLLDCALTRLARCADPFNPSALNILLYYANVLHDTARRKADAASDAPPPDITGAARILGKVLPAAIAAALMGAHVPLALTGLRILLDRTGPLLDFGGRLA